MSYIVPRDKPQECRKCPYINLYNDCKLIWGSERIRTVEEQYQHCPLIEIPTPHGRLIDADALINELASMHVGGLEAIKIYTGADTWTSGLHTAWRTIDDADTIIEAEE